MVKFTDLEMKVIANFASINSSIVVQPDKLLVLSDTSSVLGEYSFSTPFTFEKFGLFDATQFLSILNNMDKPEFEVFDRYIEIKGTNNDKLRYLTTASNLVRKMPNVEKSFADRVYNLHFNIPADKFAALTKMASILKSDYIFFESDTKCIRITAGKKLDASLDNYEICIEDDIKTNDLDEPLKISILDFKMFQGDYEVKIAKKISKWSNLNGVKYYIKTLAIKEDNKFE